MHICIAAGGTGGHLLPGVAAAKALRAQGHTVHFIVKTDRKSQSYLADEGFASSAFFFMGMPRKISLKFFSFILFSIISYSNAKRVLRREKPSVVLGMGGYFSVPLGLAAIRLKTPLVIHEQNSYAGLANKWLSRWAASVAVSFEHTLNLSCPIEKIHHTGLPIRPDLHPVSGHDARTKLGLEANRRTCLVFGGSQGAQFINQLIIDSLSTSSSDWQFIHLTGQDELEKVRQFYDKNHLPCFVQSFWQEMGLLYSAADFVVCRAGANTVFELCRMGKRALLIPYPYATNAHQESNALFLEKTGLGQMVLQENITVEKFQALLNQMPSASDLRMENESRLQNVPDFILNASHCLADLIIQTVSTSKTDQKDQKK